MEASSFDIIKKGFPPPPHPQQPIQREDRQKTAFSSLVATL